METRGTANYMFSLCRERGKVENMKGGGLRASWVTLLRWRDRSAVGAATSVEQCTFPVEQTAVTVAWNVELRESIFTKEVFSTVFILMRTH